MIAQVDVPDGATLEALYARGFLNSDPNLNVPKQPENTRKSNGMENPNFTTCSCLILILPVLAMTLK